jgi:membrane protease YdiL (CAAX protease family)
MTSQPAQVAPGSSAVRARRCLIETVCVLVAFNVARALGLLGPALVADAVLFAAVVLIAWREKLTWSDLGLRRDTMPAGFAWGVGAFGIVFLVLLVASVVPATSGFLHDSRAAISGGRMSYDLFVSILIGTVIPEELAFRGVLLGSSVQIFRKWVAVLLTSALFGLWHIAPTLHTMSDNQTVRHTPAALVVLGAVAATFVAGVVFSWLRLRSGSLIAPAIAHFATNGLALGFAWFSIHSTVL